MHSCHPSLRQLLDNDADGVVDDPTVVNYMVTNNYFMFVSATEAEAGSDNNGMPSIGFGQGTGIYEAVPNSCDIPVNRGATTNRSTWQAAVNTQTGCDTSKDATTEETLHLITEAAARIWPAKWDRTQTSTAGAAVYALNGNCGWGYTNNYQNPSTTNCNGTYAYDDATCNEACVVVEGIYWAIVSYIGGLYTSARAEDVKREWLLVTPDSSMTVVPSGVSAAKSLQSASPALYALVVDSISPEHAWIPAVMPDGRYSLTMSSSPPASTPASSSAEAFAALTSMCSAPGSLAQAMQADPSTSGIAAQMESCICSRWA